MANGNVRHPTCKNFPRTPSIHVSENPFSESSLNSWFVEKNKLSYTSMKNLTSPQPGADEEGLNSPTNQADIADAASPNHQYHRINRLLSIGPEFHIQIKNPALIESFNWKAKTIVERRLIYAIIFLLILFPILLLATTHLITKRGGFAESE